MQIQQWRKKNLFERLRGKIDHDWEEVILIREGRSDGIIVRAKQLGTLLDYEAIETLDKMLEPFF